MHEPNVARILAALAPSDLVLDIGGWARPFNRADFVIDAEPYETRGYYGPGLPAQGGIEERFTRLTWYRRDICDRARFPFGDKSIDFVTCSHVLEDVRDPLWVCSEMIRVSKRGYIEVPSRVAESCRGVEPNQVGWSHHRWLVDLQPGAISFLMKYHMIHSSRRFSFPARYGRRLAPAERVAWMFWDGDFKYRERTIHGLENIAAELDRFVRETRPYPRWMLALDDMQRGGWALARRVRGKLGRLLNG
jgi:hypothetical protein